MEVLEKINGSNMTVVQYPRLDDWRRHCSGVAQPPSKLLLGGRKMKKEKVPMIGHINWLLFSTSCVNRQLQPPSVLDGEKENIIFLALLDPVVPPLLNYFFLSSSCFFVSKILIPVVTTATVTMIVVCQTHAYSMWVTRRPD